MSNKKSFLVQGVVAAVFGVAMLLGASCADVKVQDTYPDVHDPNDHPVDPSRRTRRETVFGKGEGLTKTIPLTPGEGARHDVEEEEKVGQSDDADKDDGESS